MKVVINSCHGGFGLSHEAIVRYFELQGKKVWIEESEDWSGHFDYWLVPKEERVVNAESEFWNMSMEERQSYNETWANQNFNERTIERNDPILVQVVKELGELANGRFAELKIVDIPLDIQWTIEEYDGDEWVAEVHRTWR